MTRDPGDPLEPLREALRERGYLDRGLDRMILRDAGAPGGWLAGSVRAGLLSGTFLGLSLLLVLLLAGEPPLTSPREITLLALYLLFLSSLLMTVFEAAMSLASRLLAAFFPAAGIDAGTLARGMGAAGAIAAALSLSFWWRGRGSEGWGAAAQIAAVGAILALSLAIGRITSLAALLSLVRPGRLPAKRVRRSRGNRLAAVLLLTLVGALFAVPWGQSRTLATRDSPRKLITRPREGRILWIAVDGLGEELFGALASEGRLPSLSRIGREGCRVRIARPSSEPPAVWVSAATGFPPARHGVRGVETSTLAGIDAPVGDSVWAGPLLRAAKWMAPWLRSVREIPVSGRFRRDKTLWEIQGERGVPSYIVNWWATWPAEEGPGVRISERAFFRLEAGGAPDREVFPPEEFQRLRQGFHGFLEKHPLRQEEEEDGDPGRLGVLMDSYHIDLAREGWSQGRYPLVAVYLNGSDLIASSPRGAESPASQVRRARLLREHFDFLDERISEMALALRPQDLLVVEGDPGREREPSRDAGLLLIRGGGILQGARSDGVLLDVLPTLLRLSGFPLSREMKGRPLETCLDSSRFGSRDAPPEVSTYGDRRLPDGRGSDFDPEVIEKLRSLGYIR
jgi:hypothetical protein